MICYFVVIRLISFFFGEQKNNEPKHPDPHNVLKEVPEVKKDSIPTKRQTQKKEVNITQMVEIAKPLPKKPRKNEQKKMDTPPKKELTKKRSWRKKIFSFKNRWTRP